MIVKILTKASAFKFDLDYWSLYSTKTHLLMVERKIPLQYEDASFDIFNKHYKEKVRSVSFNKQYVRDWRIDIGTDDNNINDDSTSGSVGSS